MKNTNQKQRLLIYFTCKNFKKNIIWMTCIYLRKNSKWKNRDLKSMQLWSSHQTWYIQKIVQDIFIFEMFYTWYQPWRKFVCCIWCIREKWDREKPLSFFAFCIVNNFSCTLKQGFEKTICYIDHLTKTTFIFMTTGAYS